MLSLASIQRLDAAENNDLEESRDCIGKAEKTLLQV
jgi:hypothetical protein